VKGRRGGGGSSRGAWPRSGLSRRRGAAAAARPRSGLGRRSSSRGARPQSGLSGRRGAAAAPAGAHLVATPRTDRRRLPALRAARHGTDRSSPSRPANGAQGTSAPVEGEGEQRQRRFLRHCLCIESSSSTPSLHLSVSALALTTIPQGKNQIEPMPGSTCPRAPAEVNNPQGI
jgi:hypothetical protein